MPGWQLPQQLRIAAGSVTLRPATIEDLPAVVELLADDPIGATRDGAAPDGLRPYLQAQNRGCTMLRLLLPRGFRQ